MTAKKFYQSLDSTPSSWKIYLSKRNALFGKGNRKCERLKVGVAWFALGYCRAWIDVGASEALDVPSGSSAIYVCDS